MAKSRYFNTDVLGNTDEPAHYATPDLPTGVRGIAIDLLDGVTTTTHRFALGDRLDKLANQFFGDDEYWWIIALVNGINYSLGVPLGTELVIPTDIVPVLQKLDLM